MHDSYNRFVTVVFPSENTKEVAMYFDDCNITPAICPKFTKGVSVPLAEAREFIARLRELGVGAWVACKKDVGRVCPLLTDLNA